MVPRNNKRLNEIKSEIMSFLQSTQEFESAKDYYLSPEHNFDRHFFIQKSLDTLYNKKLENKLNINLEKYLKKLPDDIRTRLSDYILNKPGKRLLPLLIIRFAQLMHATKEQLQQAYIYAVCMEMLLTFSLIHDDIIDKAPLRRGNEPYYIIHGMEHAIQDADILYTNALSFIPDTDHEALIFILKISEAITTGNNREIMDRRNNEFDLSLEYLIEKIRLKTAILFYACIHLAGIATQQQSITQTLELPISNLGVAFLLQDDILEVEEARLHQNSKSKTAHKITDSILGNLFWDIQESKLGHEVFWDIQESKRNLFLHFALQDHTNTERLQAIYSKSIGEKSNEEVNIVLNIFNQEKIKSQVFQVRDALLEQSRSQLMQLQEDFESNSNAKIIISEIHRIISILAPSVDKPSKTMINEPNLVKKDSPQKLFTPAENENPDAGLSDDLLLPPDGELAAKQYHKADPKHLEEILRKHLLNHLHQQIDRLPENVKDRIREFIVSTQGKMLRPILVGISATFLGASKDQLAMALNSAVSVELLHNFTLIHDDLLDGAPLRRGKDAYHIQHGINLAIHDGDILHTYALSFVDDPESLQLILDISNGVGRGNGIELEYRIENVFDFSRENVIEILRLKTAIVFSGCIALAGIATNRQDVTTPLEEIITNAGIAFQIQDDILDILGDEEQFGKESYWDIQESKRNLFLYYALQGENKEHIQEIYTKNVGEKTKEDIKFVLEAFKDVQSQVIQDRDTYLENCLKQLNQKIEEAQRSPETKDLEKLYEFLKELIIYICTREK